MRTPSLRTVALVAIDIALMLLAVYGAVQIFGAMVESPLSFVR